MPTIRPLLALPLLAMLLAGQTSSVVAATFTVTRGDDPPPGSCLANDCSLREAVAATVTTPEADLIQLDAGQYQVTRGPIAVSGTVTIAGTGSATSSIIGTASFSIIAAPFSALTLQGLRLARPDENGLLLAEGNSMVTLRDVAIPAGTMGVDSSSVTGVHFRIEDSSIRLLACFQSGGSCRAFRSRLQQFVAGNAEVEFRHVELDGEDLEHWGVSIYGYQPVLIEDSTIRRMNHPLILRGDSVPAPNVVIRRTRFLDNNSALTGDRNSMVLLDDVEFRRHIVANDELDRPAVLLAGPTTRWRFARALIANNRGGSGDGSTIRVIEGGYAAFLASTFDDNTFRSEAGSAFGHTIGIAAIAQSAILLIYNSTLRRTQGGSITDFTAGTLLAARGALATVSLLNNVLVGTCRFADGAAFNPSGITANVESSRNTCALPTANNDNSVPTASIALAALADNGGFTHTLMPAATSFLIGRGNVGGCTLLPLDQRRRARPGADALCDVGAVERDGIVDTIFANGMEPQAGFAPSHYPRRRKIQASAFTAAGISDGCTTWMTRPASCV